MKIRSKFQVGDVVIIRPVGLMVHLGLANRRAKIKGIHHSDKECGTSFDLALENADHCETLHEMFLAVEVVE